MPGLDGLRGVAVAAVIIYHFEPSWLPGGFIGVDVFFVLSGFLISSLLLRERTVTGTVDAGRFFVRRLRRLMPALLLLLIALAVYAATWADPVELSRLRRHGFGTVTYVSNWIFIADGTTYTDIVVGTSPLRHVWSLAIEEQLYIVLVCGVIGTAALVSTDRLRRWFGILAGLLAVLSAVWMAWLSIGGASTERTYFGTDTRAHAMLIGAVIGAMLFGRPAPDRAAVRYGGWAGLAVLAVVARFGAEDARWLHQGGFLVVAIAAGAVVIAGASNRSMRAGFSVRPLVVVGMLSYGLYLWHWPVLVIFDQQRTGVDGLPLMLLRLIISVSAAVVSYALVERPIRGGALGRRWGRGAVVPAALSVALVLAVFARSTAVPASSAVTLQADAPGSTFEPSSLPETTDPPIRGTAVSDDGIAPATTAAPRPVKFAVLGDSVVHTIIGGEVSAVGLQFTQWTPEQTTFDPQVVEVTSIAKPACSFLPGEIAVLEPNGSFNHASLERFCQGWSAELDEALNSADVFAVHLTNDLEDRWIDDGLFEFGTPAYFELLGSFLNNLHLRTRADKVPMLLVASAPRGEPSWRDDPGNREAMVAAFYEQWASARPDVSTVDMGALICPGSVCLDEVDGVEWRWDGRHYTRNGALGVVRWLTPIILEAALNDPHAR
ncbi:acyltransferase family protein [uncultured Ilumatobacter sp.]|uniref:acyltransferase family protein n=1 Tax=uncultured Ilumatobacter sp. TaxID=879968 RepID=UPI00374F1B64